MMLMRLVTYTLLFFSVPPQTQCSKEGADSEKLLPMELVARQVEATAELMRSANAPRADRRLPQWPPPQANVPQVNTIVNTEPRVCLLTQLPKDLIDYLLVFLEHHRDMARLSRTCRMLNKQIKNKPYAPGHLHDVMLRAIHPHLRREIPLSDFIEAFELDTIRGRSDFYKRVTVPGFLSLVKKPLYKGYFLGVTYLNAKKVLKSRKDAFQLDGSIGTVRIALTDSIYPPEMSELSYLESIDFPATGMYGLPRSIGQLTQLKHLACSQGNIRFLPAELSTLRHLETLDVSDNLLQELPASMAGLSSLRELNVEGNPIESFPLCLLAMNALTKLRIGRTKMTLLPPNICSMSGLKQLSLSNYGRGHSFGLVSGNTAFGRLTQLPFGFGQLASLEKLELSGHQLSELPHSFRRLKSLMNLDLTGNGLEVFPVELVFLTSLRTLMLRGNPLTMLPEELIDILGLHKVDIRDTLIALLPKGLSLLGPYMEINHMVSFSL